MIFDCDYVDDIRLRLPQWPTTTRPNVQDLSSTRFALMMSSLAQRGQIDQSAALFSISKSRAVVFVNEVLDAAQISQPAEIAMPQEDKIADMQTGLYYIPGLSGRAQGNGIVETASRQSTCKPS
ncbi:hypothetical protein PybrP1_012524 [[Pythium] brassicae (nom. inval.)]|nr:hypothetical protein PybrP1_012524 [[Pythium] brassicae (nom. inval.)]